MADQKELLVLLKTVFESAGYDELKKATEDIEKRQQQSQQDGEKRKQGAKEEADVVGQLQSKILGWAAAYVSVQAAWQFASDSFKSAIEDEAGMYRLGASLRAVAGADDAAVAASHEFIAALETQSAIADDELRPALTRLAATTGDVTQAQNLLKLAADAANAGLGDVGGITQTLIRFNETGGVSKRATDAFSVSLRNELAKSGGDADKALNNLARTYEDLAKKNDTIEFQQRQQKIAWDNTKEAVGGVWASLVMQLSPALEFLAYGLTMVFGGLRMVVAGFQSAFLVMEHMSVALAMLTVGNFKGAAAMMKKGATEAKTAWEEASESVTKSLENIGDAFDRTKQAQAGPIHTTPKGKGGDDKEGEDRLKRLQDLASREKQIDAEKVRGKKATAEELAAIAKSQADAEKLMMEEQRKRADQLQQLDEIRVQRRINSGKMTDAQELAWLKQKQKRLQDEAKAAEGNVDAQIKAEQKLLANEQRTAALEKKIEQQRVAAKKQMTNSLVSLGKQLAGENSGMAKAMQHVEAAVALMEGIKATQLALSFPPGPPVTLPSAIATAAYAASNVAAIEGIGFDDPQNDAIMRAASRKWASDMARETILGHADGWREGLEDSRRGGGGTTINNHVTNPGSTYHTKNFYIDAAVLDTGRDQTLRDLSVKMREMDRLTDEGKVR